MASSPSILVVSRYKPGSFKYSNDDGNDDTKKGSIIIDHIESKNDKFDTFNHPRIRRALILEELGNSDSDMKNVSFQFETPSNLCKDLNSYVETSVTSSNLIEFLTTSFKKWDQLLIDKAQDPMCSMVVVNDEKKDNGNDEDDELSPSPPLIPGNVILHRLPEDQQRPSLSVMGQIGYYCTDTCTPIFQQLYDELLYDASIMEYAVEAAVAASSAANAPPTAVYALGTHPGHHAAYDSFGGYCYVNHAAVMARLLQKKMQNGEEGVTPKVAILDVDYHCGNGTASIFYDDPTVLVISIHCDPDYEYPFHAGFSDQIGAGDGKGATLHIPLPIGTCWDKNSNKTDHTNSKKQKTETYKEALEDAMKRIEEFNPTGGIIVSLGLDTHAGDPCTLRRAGFELSGTDYFEMGQMIGQYAAAVANNNTNNDDNDSKSNSPPVIFIQEGGYYMEKVPKAVKDVLVGFAEQH